jgi:CRISPR-associated protein Cas2
LRQRYIVTYDIGDPKRLRQVFKTMKGFGRHLQFSVFSCDLAAVALVRLKIALNEVIDSLHDQVLIIDIGPSEGRAGEAIESLGRRAYLAEPPPKVV